MVSKVLSPPPSFHLDISAHYISTQFQITAGLPSEFSTDDQVSPADFVPLHLPGPNSPYIVALLMADCAYLACGVSMYSPSAWMLHLEGFVQPGDRRLHHLQNMFTKVYPVGLISQTAVVWFSFSYLWEEHTAMSNPMQTINWNKRHLGPKYLFSVFSVAIIIHLLHFFKFEIEEGPDGSQICLSDLFTESSYQTMDKIVYFVIFAVIPWFLILFMLLRLGWLVIGNKRAHAKLSDPRVELDNRTMRLFKKGRSLRAVVAISILFLVLHGISDIMYAEAIDTMYTIADVESVKQCHPGVTDFKFHLEAQEIELCYVACQVVYSSCKFWVLFLCSSSFRKVFYSWVRFQWRMLKGCTSTLCGKKNKKGKTMGKKSKLRPYVMPLRLLRRQHSSAHSDLEDDVFSIESASSDESCYRPYRPTSSGNTTLSTILGVWPQERPSPQNRPSSSYTRITYI